MCDQLMHNSLISFWCGSRVMFWESHSSTFWFQLVCGGLCAGGQHAVNFLQPVRVLIFAKQLKDMSQDMIYSLEEELKVLEFVLCLNYYCFFSLDCFPLFLHFLTSLTEFLWNSRKA